MITAERARELLRYDPETGKLFWKKRVSSQRPEGSEAGCVSLNRKIFYRHVRVDSRLYRAHRLIWLIVTGKWPLGEVDHQDGDGLNNRWANLRDVTGLENKRNQRLRSDNTSGICGVSWEKRQQKWVVHVGVGKPIHVGVFDSFEDAIAARKIAEAKHGYHLNHGKPRRNNRPSDAHDARRAKEAA